jgi:hypothetical protein
MKRMQRDALEQAAESAFGGGSDDESSEEEEEVTATRAAPFNAFALLGGDTDDDDDDEVRPLSKPLVCVSQHQPILFARWKDSAPPTFLFTKINCANRSRSDELPPYPPAP